MYDTIGQGLAILTVLGMKSLHTLNCKHLNLAN